MGNVKTYKSHKHVRAAKILEVHYNALNAVAIADDATVAILVTGEGESHIVTHRWMKKNAGEDYAGPDAERDLVGGYLVEYADGYVSWSPAKAFEEGYTEHSLDPKDGALPVAGYKPQSEEAVALVNEFKHDEERLLRKLDAMAAATRKGPNDAGPNPYDGRWLAIGRTHLEQAFMAINRSIFKPGRVNLAPEAQD